jgi:hypothetical protein
LTERVDRPLLRSTGAAEPSASPAPLARAVADRGANTAAMVRLLEQLVGEVRGMRRELAEQPAAIANALTAAQRTSGGSLSKSDRAALVTLLPAIAGAVGGDLRWTIGELLAHARLDDVAETLLRFAIERSVGKLDAPATAKRLGKLFARAAGFMVGDLYVERIRQDRAGVVWTVRGFQSRTKPQSRAAV